MTKKDLILINSREKYSTLELIKDLRNEIQSLSEELALIFPERLEKFPDAKLSEIWGKSESYVRSVLYYARRDNNYLVIEKPLFRLEERLGNRLGAKALGCIQIIGRYRNNEISTLQFVNMLEKELGRISGEITVNNEELGLILHGTDSFIKNIKSRITNPNNNRYNPHYKFSKLILQEFRDFTKNIWGKRAMKIKDFIDKYEQVNPDLKDYPHEQYTIKHPHYFKDVDKSEEVSYWFGFFRADGSFEPRRYRISFELATKDRERLESFAKSIGFPLKRIKDRIRYVYYKGELKLYYSSRVSFISKPTSNDFKDLEFSSFKSKVSKVPYYVKKAVEDAKEQKKVDWWLSKSGKIALAWLLGYFDGDGYLSHGKYQYLEICSSSKMLIEDIRLIFGIKSNVREKISPGDTALVFDCEIISIGLYTLKLGAKVSKWVMESYPDSMWRKRPSEFKNRGSQNYLGDYI